MLTNIIGDCGSGKGILQVALILEVLKILGNKKRIAFYTNFKMQNIPNWFYLEPDMLFDIGNDKNFDLYEIFIDEATAWLENRVSSHDETNMYLSYMLFQSRKSKQDWHIAEQLGDTIDKRFLKMAKMTFFMADRKVREMGEYSKDDFNYAVINKYGAVRTKHIPYKQATKFFSYYNTDEKIYPPSFEKLQFKMNSKNSKKLDSVVGNITKEVLEIVPYEYKNIKLAQVKDAILKLKKYPVDYAPYVLARIQNKNDN